LGVVASDVNNDGQLDLFVANDTVENFLLMNRDGRRWEDAGDIDGYGWQDLFVSNTDKEMFALYRNTGTRVFDDQ
jgi:enediyne biosynthesis protein E4